MLEKNIYISFVVPVYNEEGNVAKLHKEILEVAKKIGKSFEIIFVDDGSWDKTIEVISQLKPLKIIRFRKNAVKLQLWMQGLPKQKENMYFFFGW
jgi:glycosyltransferase involved in cell wall biosynthesis